jgi:hypothetical protein
LEISKIFHRSKLLGVAYVETNSQKLYVGEFIDNDQFFNFEVPLV